MKKLSVLTLLAIAFSWQAQATISQIRWGTNQDPLTGLTLTWSSTGKTDSVKWGYTTSYEKGSFAGKSRTGYVSGTLFFKYVFPTVTASKTIYYELYDSKAKTWGSKSTFVTAPKVNTSSYSFVGLGDCRDYPMTLRQVTKLALASNPTFVLFNGDLTVSGTSSAQYDTFFVASSTLLSNKLVLHAIGNHDYASPSEFSNLWDLPQVNSQNLYYSVKYGNGIFITLDANNFADTAQLGWLTRTLKTASADTSIKWKVISQHQAWFTNGAHSGDIDSYRSSYWTLFDTYGVDLVITGHDHNYQRSYPINWTLDPSKPVSTYGSSAGEGRLEIVAGGAGAGLYTAGGTPDAWAIKVFNSTYNYVYFNVTGCKMKIIAYNSSNTVIDSLTLDKTGTTLCTTTVTDVDNMPAQTGNLILFPNPVNKSSFTLQYSSELNGNAKVTICDLTGKEVATQSADKTSHDLKLQFNMANLPNGVYNVTVTIGDTRETKLLVLSK